MQPDVRQRAVARAVYDACYLLAPIPFDEAERRRTFHYKRAMAAAERVSELCSE